MGVSWGVRIRVFILLIMGACFFFPGVLLLIAGFMEPDITADDTLAMFVMGGGLTFIGLLIWFAMRKVYRRGKRYAAYLRSQEDEGMLMGMGMAQAHYIASMNDSDGNNMESANVDADFDSGGDFDGGGDFDIGD